MPLVLLALLVACPLVGGDDTASLSDTGTPATQDTGPTGTTETGGTGTTGSTGETGDTAPPIDSGLFLIDTDGDGLSDGLELQLGWDPESTDGDGDGFGDAEEYAAGTDGSLPWSWPLEGCRWPDLYDEGAALVGEGTTGWNDLEHVPDLTFVDQCGTPVSLWQFPGHVIVLDMAAVWCGPCQDSAAMLQSVFETYRGRGYVLLTALQGATLEESQEWAATYGSTHPVSGDTDGVLAVEVAARTTRYPSYMLVDADLTVRSVKQGESPQSWFDLYVPGLQDERDAALE